MSEPATQMLEEAMRARARSDVDILLTLASTVKATWADVLRDFPVIFTQEANAKLERIEQAQARRRGP